MIVFLVDNYIFYVVLFLSLLILTFLLWKEIKRTNRQRLGLRITANILAIVSLLFLALQPAYLSRQKTETAILLTEEYSPKTLDSLLKINRKALIFSYTNTSTLAKPTSIDIPDLAFLQRNYPQIHTLFIVGDGIPEYDLCSLENTKIKRLLNQIPEGIIALEKPDKIAVNELFSIKGIYNQIAGKKRKLILESPDGVMDSVIFEKKGRQNFSLKIQSKTAGSFLYTLLLKDEKNQVLGKEKLPLTIQTEKKLSFWIFNSSPRFESKYLKNHLAEAGHQVAIRSTISKNKYKEEFINQKKTFSHFDKNLADKADIILMDASYLQTLNPTEQAFLQEAIAEKGLSLLIQGDEEILTHQKNTFLKTFLLTNTATDTLQFSAVNYGIKDKYTLKKQNYRLNPSFGLIPLLKDQAGNISIAYQIKGLGKIALSLTDESYPMLLDGKKDLYEIYWTNLLKELAPKEATKNKWGMENPFVVEKEPVIFNLKSEEEKPVGILKNPSGKSEKFYLKQDNEIAENWQGKIWVEQKGWYQLQTEKDSIGQFFYIYSENDWKSLKTTRQITANKLYFKKQASNATRAEVQSYAIRKPLSLLWFYLIFLLSAGFLWLEAKL